MAVELGAPVIEIHTGAWCEALAHNDKTAAATEWRRIVEGAQLAKSLGLEVHAGHGLDYESAEMIAMPPLSVCMLTTIGSSINRDPVTLYARSIGSFASP